MHGHGDSAYWPKHDDGRNKKMKEMTPDERDRVARLAVHNVAKEFAPLGIDVEYGGIIGPASADKDPFERR